MHCVLSLCMWSVFGLCAVRHRIGHRWGSRGVPSWQNLLRLQIMVCVHVSVNVCADEGWNMTGVNVFTADCLLVGFMELKEFEENVSSSSLCHGLTWSGNVVSAHFSFFDTIMTCFIMHGTGSAYELLPRELTISGPRNLQWINVILTCWKDWLQWPQSHSCTQQQWV